MYLRLFCYIIAIVYWFHILCSKSYPNNSANKIGISKPKVVKCALLRLFPRRTKFTCLIFFFTKYRIRLENNLSHTYLYLSHTYPILIPYLPHTYLFLYLSFILVELLIYISIVVCIVFNLFE